MNNFSLTQTKEKTFPTAIMADGKVFFINADYRIILKILKMAEDDRISERNKQETLNKWFYADKTPNRPYEQFILFMDGLHDNSKKHGTEDKKERQFCFEFDAQEIYISFLQEYQIDLVEIPFLHWYKFKILLQGLSSSSSFMQKIQLRFMDLKDYKGKQLQNLQEAKENVQLPVKLTSEEKAEQQEFKDKWNKIGY